MAVKLVEFLADTEREIEIRDMHDAAVAAAASYYGIRRLPAIVIDGQLADRYAGRGHDEVTPPEGGRCRSGSSGVIRQGRFLERALCAPSESHHPLLFRAF